jgi:predicted acylesterase/phospholipase RssA
MNEKNSEETRKADFYTTIVLGGGGTKCISTIGAMQYLYDSGRTLKDGRLAITRFIGTSAGAMICLFLAVGYTPVEIMVQICTRNVMEALLPLDFVSLVTGNGAIPYARLDTCIRNMLAEKCDPDITLEGLYKTGRELVCTTYNMTDGKCEYVSWKTHPDLLCRTAVQMSSSLPFVFDECVVDGKIYLDGGIVDNFPIVAAQLLDSEEKVFGCALFTKYDSLHTQNRLLSLVRVLSTVASNFYIERIISQYEPACQPLVVGERNDRSSCPRRGPGAYGSCDILKIHLNNSDIMEFDKSHQSKLEMFSLGYNCCQTFYKSRSVNE